MSLPAFRLQSLSSTDQTQMPFTLGHAFVAGDLKPSDGLKAGTIPLQVDVKAVHADGSVRHAILSGVLPKLAAGETVALQLEKAKPSAVDPHPGVLQQLANLDAKIVLALAGETYTASVKGAQFGDLMMWLSGPIVMEGQFSVPLKNAAGAEHPSLTARFGVRYYPDAKAARVEFIVENTKTFKAANRFQYDVDLYIGDKAVYSKKGLTHYHHSRWHKYAWWGQEPQTLIQHDPAYLIATKALPNFDLTFAPSASNLDYMASLINETNTGPMTIGPVAWNMGMTGGRADIGPLPTWHTMHLLSQDQRARATMMAAAEGSGSWSTHYRDEKTGYPLSIATPGNGGITLHPNLNWRGPLPVPRAEGDNNDLLQAVAADDTSHQPALTYYPYLITGDYYLLEELQFWATTNPLNADPNGYEGEKGLIRWQQVRGQAWSLRTLGHVAYITPDAHPLKKYFVNQVEANVAYYTDVYVNGKPNNFGAIDGSGPEAFRDIKAFAPWQDDFFTWSVGNLVELGFSSALPLLKWKAQFPVGRMVAPGTCWLVATQYTMKYRDDKDQKVDSFAAIFDLNYGGDFVYNDDVAYLPNPDGVKFSSLPCNSQQQIDFLTKIHKFTWVKGRMVGFATSADGYPSYMQPALAMAVDSGDPDAVRAWELFMSRSCKPDYREAPQWSILPRTIATPAQQLPTTPTPAPVATAPTPVVSASAPLKIGAQPKNAGTWTKIAAEGEHVKPAKGDYVRYGIGDKFIYAQASGEFDATNSAFGKDPAINVVKQVDVFTPAPAPAPVPKMTYRIEKVTKYVLYEAVADTKGIETLTQMAEFDMQQDADMVKAALEKANVA